MEKFLPGKYLTGILLFIEFDEVLLICVWTLLANSVAVLPMKCIRIVIEVIH